MPAMRRVYVGLLVPAADSIPKPERIEVVFDTQEAAQTWADELPPRPGGASAYRRWEPHEVVRDRV